MTLIARVTKFASFYLQITIKNSLITPYKIYNLIKTMKIPFISIIQKLYISIVALYLISQSHEIK